MSQLKPIMLFVLFISTTYICAKIYNWEIERRSLKEDMVELSRVRYGLMSVDTWKKIVANIITKKINELDLQEADKAAAEEKIQNLLYQLMDDYEASYRKDQSRSIGGFFRTTVADLADVFGKMRREVPNFTKRIMAFIEDPENRENLRHFILSKLEDYTDETFSPIDYADLNKVLARYDQDDSEKARVNISDRLTDNSIRQRPFILGMYAAVGLLFLTLIFFKQFSQWSILIISLTSLCLLLMGVSLPMIDIDARISEMNFTLLGEEVKFADQVLFFKSKSILEVTELMISQGKLDVIIVGILIFLFSVLFPVIKLFSGVSYAFKKNWRQSKVLNFFVFKTGKWSMADVMVVAIFMSFIGFSGIITEQLRQLENMTQKMEILTTNESQLQMGFFLFTTFVLISLMTSHRIQSDAAKTLS